MLTPAVAAAESSSATTDSVPTAFADRLDALPWDLRARSPDTSATVEDRPPLAAEPAVGPVVDEDDRALDLIYGRGAANSARKPNLWPRLLLGVAVVAVAAVTYWKSVRPTQSPDPAVVQTAPTTTPGPTSSAPTGPSPTADTPSETKESPGNSLPTESPVTSSAQSSESPPTSSESTAPSAAAGAPVAKQTPENPDARLPPRANPNQSRVGKTAKTTTPRPSSDSAGSTTAQARTPEQAERDALATRRLIERELGNSPRADSTNGEPSSGQ